MAWEEHLGDRFDSAARLHPARRLARLRQLGLEALRLRVQQPRVQAGGRRRARARRLARRRRHQALRHLLPPLRRQRHLLLQHQHLRGRMRRNQ